MRWQTLLLDRECGIIFGVLPRDIVYLVSLRHWMNIE